MPERRPTARPDIVAGTVLESGTPNTGQILQTLGGSHVAMRYSGVVGPDINLWVGGGRLDNAMLYSLAAPGTLAASGQPVIFYDSAVAVSGGPLSTSGHKVVGVLRAGNISSGLTLYGEVRQFGAVFTSGLCFTTRSGQGAWTASFTPAISG